MVFLGTGRLFGYLMTISNEEGYTASNFRSSINDELRKTWKEAAATYFKVKSHNFSTDS